jgi:hypothetical protein
LSCVKYVPCDTYHHCYMNYECEILSWLFVKTMHLNMNDSIVPNSYNNIDINRWATLWKAISTTNSSNKIILAELLLTTGWLCI